MMISFTYPYNLFCNICIIVKYIYIEIIYFVVTHRQKPFENYLCWYAMCHAMIQILKYDAKIISYDKNVKIQTTDPYIKIRTDIDLIVLYKKQLYCIEIKHITNNNNSEEYTYIAKQLNKQRNLINISNINHILYICGTKLKENTERMIIDANPNIHIMYNTLYFPMNTNLSCKKNIILCQSALGYIVNYYNTDWMYKQIVSKLTKYTMYTSAEIYKEFDKRMVNSNIEIERYRWNQLKNKIITFDKLDNNIHLYDTFFSIKKKYKYFIKFGIENNCKFISEGSDMTCDYINPYLIDYIKIKSIGIYGSGSDNLYKSKHIILQYMILFKYKLFFMYTVFMQL